MALRSRFFLVAVALVAMLVVAACGGGGAAGNTVGTPGEQLAFDPATMTLPANQEQTVTFTNNSTGQQHNWVLVNGGDDVAAEVDEAAAANGGNIDANHPSVIAATRLLAGGQNESVTFTTPGPGTYTYLCTFPGHFPAGMKGTLTVQ